VGHGRSNSFDRMIALEPFRRSASGRNKLPTYLELSAKGSPDMHNTPNPAVSMARENSAAGFDHTSTCEEGR